MKSPDTPIEHEIEVLLAEALPQQASCRDTKRYRCSPSALVQLHLTQERAKLEAWAFDLSEQGIGLNLPYPLELGTALVLRLRGRRASGMVTLAAKVVHAREQEHGNWRIGCLFEKPLSREKLQTLL